MYLEKENNDKDLKFKFVDHVTIYHSTKIFLLKALLKIGLTKFLRLTKLKILYHGHMLLMILMVKKKLELFKKNHCKNKLKRTCNRKSNQKARS